MGAVMVLQRSTRKLEFPCQYGQSLYNFSTGSVTTDYRFYGCTHTHDGARQLCAERGGRLFLPKSKEENDVEIMIFRAYNSQYCILLAGRHRRYRKECTNGWTSLWPISPLSLDGGLTAWATTSR